MLTTRRQRLVVDLDQLGGVAGLRQRLGDDEGDAVADVADAVGDEQRLEGAVALRRAEILRHQRRGDGAELVGDDVGAGQHQQHAGRGLGLGDVELLDPGVGVRRQHVDAVGHAGQHDVVDVAALPGQEALVLDPAHRLSDPELGHVLTPGSTDCSVDRDVSRSARSPCPHASDARRGRYLFSQRRMKPSRPWGRKMMMAMKMKPSGIR